MSHRTESILPADIQEVKGKFDHWRHTRSKRGPIPEGLWKQAVILAQKHGISHIASILKLNTGRLGENIRLVGTKQLNSGSSDMTRFIEVNPADPEASSASRRQCTIEFSSADRGKMTIRLTDWSDENLAHLARAWMAPAR